MSRGVRLSKKHGVNPCLGVCFYCGEDSGEIGLLGLLKGDVEAPRKAVLSREPCATCKGHQKAGVILISVRDGEESANPFRTGGWVVVTDDAITRWIADVELRASVLRQRFAFVPDAAWKLLGLAATAAQEVTT